MSTICIYVCIEVNMHIYINVYTLLYCRFSIIKMFAQNKEDRKRVEKALDISGFPSAKVSVISYRKSFDPFYLLQIFLLVFRTM